jgi:hypothetical protein
MGTGRETAVVWTAGPTSGCRDGRGEENSDYPFPRRSARESVRDDTKDDGRNGS